MIMKTRTVLVIEDDAAIRTGVIDSLEANDYNVLSADNGKDGMRMAVRVDYDLVLLDLVLPEHTGLEILAELRLTRPTVPVIILSALGDEKDRVKGLQLGADDYVVKPFSMKELLARVEAVLRRSPERPSDVHKLTIPGGVADFDRNELSFEDGERVELSDREMSLLRYLAGNRGPAQHRWRRAGGTTDHDVLRRGPFQPDGVDDGVADQ